MIPERVAEFPISEELVMLNHASFGLMTNVVKEAAERTRTALELDSLALIDPEALVPRLRDAAQAVEQQLDLSVGSVALTQNATAGAAALMRSTPLQPGDQVVVLSTEYDSIIHGWRVRCAEAGARFVRFDVPIPLESVEQALEALERTVTGSVAVAQLSLVTSSTAVALPVAALTEWFRGRGARVYLDVAHGPGHVAIEERWGASAMFGTLHKWYPTPRPVGLLWLAPDLADSVRPAEVSLTWESSDLVERFSWPGTFDPTPRLCVRTALEEWDRWSKAGDLERCRELADYASERIAALGTPTSVREFFPPRLRAVRIPHAKADARRVLDQAGVRGWTGTGPSGETTLRVATHVFNEMADVDRLCKAVGSL